MTCRCFNCGQDFYIEGSGIGVTDESVTDDEIIADEEALHAAEEELKREIEDNDDRRCS